MCVCIIYDLFSLLTFLFIDISYTAIGTFHSLLRILYLQQIPTAFVFLFPTANIRFPTCYRSALCKQIVTLNKLNFDVYLPSCLCILLVLIRLKICSRLGSARDFAHVVPG